MAKRLLGKEVNASLNKKIKKEVLELKDKGIEPAICMIRVGEHEDDISYERGASKRAETLGVKVIKRVLPLDIEERELVQVIKEANMDASIHGVLLFRPLPKHINEKRILEHLDPAKDIDGITKTSMASIYSGDKEGFPPCTAAACMEILNHYQIDLTGKKVVVIGRSLVVGKPVSMMILKENGTVTICHSKTEDLPSVTREADIVIVAAGKARIIGKEYLKEGQIVIDVGIHVDENGKLCGDVKLEEAEELVEGITPVPGGVGTVTTSILISHVVKAANRQR
ncbi:MAG TPA: bifunctional 5,10-methylene-tetrahydrofolate dehydrogenase/5,10-methylene-tetrahydrofolate cyclohydrolase [Candidatus Merdenecus merdavium]|nr:bifunctional 5,10-methylene-tetrahydrofolate dehydrogenase/5,10-methylene-tetrahydrofolate cyclohydrolase [Candidatus Merdenecus merdavium]